MDQDTTQGHCEGPGDMESELPRATAEKEAWGTEGDHREKELSAA